MPRLMPQPLTGLMAASIVWLGVVFSTLPAAAIDIQRVTSPAGIEAWLIEDHSLPLIAVEFAFKGGARLDPSNRTGLAYLMSSLMDEGAGDMSAQAFQQKVETLGLRLSFEAGRDAMYGSLRTLTSRASDGFGLLGLALNQPRFDAEAMERMRAQILSGLKRDLEDPATLAGRRWFANAFPDHAYGRSVKGTPQTISAIRRSDLQAHARQIFDRENLMIAVVGDVTAESLGTLLDASFGALPSQTVRAQTPHISPRLPGATDVLIREVPQTSLIFGHKGIARDDPDYITAFVVNYVLGGGGFSSRLTEEIREKRGLTYSIYSYFQSFDHGEVFIGRVGTKNASAAETLAIVRTELGRLRDTGITEEELSDAKTYLTGAYPLRFDSHSGAAGQLLGIQLSDFGIDYVDRRNGLIEAVTLEEANRVARRLINPDDLIIVAVGQPDGLDVVPEAATQ